MKYVKFTQVDAKTGISANMQTPKEGATNPYIKGLNILFQDNRIKEFFYGTADDDAVDNPDNQCWFITYEEFAEIVKDNLYHLIELNKQLLYNEEIQLRRQLLVGKYDDTASIAGIYKYDQAKKLLNDSTYFAPEIEQEATYRNIDKNELALKIVEHHESFRYKEAKIAGIRGKQLDRLNNFVFDYSDAWSNWEEFHKMEKIGEYENKDVMVRYYGFELMERYNRLEI